MTTEEKALEEAKKAEIAKAAEELKKSLGLDKYDGILERMEAMEKKATENVMKVFVTKDLQKEVKDLTAEEKVKAYTAAVFTGNEASVKALSEGTDADGGYLVPTEFYGQLLQELSAASIYRPLVQVVTMSRRVMALDQIVNGPDVYWTAEGAQKTTTSAEFVQPTLTARKLAAIIYLTDELIEDSVYDITNVLIQRFAKKMAEKEDAAISGGNGTTQPEGLFVATGIGSRTAGVLDFDDIIDLIYDLPQEYRANARFVINGVNIRELRKLKDSNGRYLWQDAVAPGQPATISGYPVVEDPRAPESQILFGDLKAAYWFGDRQRMTVKITQDTETAFHQDKTAIRVVERVAGLVVWKNALRKLTGIA